MSSVERTLTRQRRATICDVLKRGGFTRGPDLIAAVESRLGPGVFGPQPRARLRSDLRSLRRAGVAIGYNRRRGTTGYYLRLDALDEAVITALEQVFRELDFEHLDRIARVTPQRRLEAMFEMIAFAHELSAAGRRNLANRKASAE